MKVPETDEEFEALAALLDEVAEVLQHECFRFTAAMMRRTAVDIRADDIVSRMERKRR